jgi:hypothetical protein
LLVALHATAQRVTATVANKVNADGSDAIEPLAARSAEDRALRDDSHRYLRSVHRGA